MAKIKAKGTPKAIKRKHLSLPEFFERFGTEEQCICYFEKQKWPNGFICPVCGEVEYLYLKNSQRYECRRCGHQTTIKAGTVMENSKLPLRTWLLMMYLIACSVNGISALELSRQAKIGYTAAKLNSRKLKYAMSERNGLYKLEGIVEIDEIKVGAPTPGHIGAASEKQDIEIMVQMHNNSLFPKYVKFCLLSSLNGESIKETILAYVKSDSKLLADGAKAYKVLKTNYIVEQEVNNYKKDPDQHLWVNTLTSNLKSFILGTYHGVAKKYLFLAIAEFEWRYNRRTFGREMINSMTRAVIGVKGITHKKLIRLINDTEQALAQQRLESLIHAL